MAVNPINLGSFKPFIVLKSHEITSQDNDAGSKAVSLLVSYVDRQRQRIYSRSVHYQIKGGDHEMVFHLDF